MVWQTNASGPIPSGSPGLTGGITTGPSGLTTSLMTYYQLFSQLTQDLILTLEGQNDSLAAVMLQNWQGLDLLTVKNGGHL